MLDQFGITHDRAHRAYENALRQANRRKFANIIRPRCNHLLPADRIFGRLNLAAQENRGVQQVPLERIIGSAGRHQDFDLLFHPRHRGSESRWTRVAEAFDRKVTLPPVSLYKVGDAYFVQDGHHRISVARAAERRQITALVTELDPSTLIPSASCERLGYHDPTKTVSCSRR